MAGRLADRLKARFDSVEVFMDVDGIEPGADFIRAIDLEVGSCDLLIALIGPRWLAVDEQLGRPRLYEDDDFVALEIRTALERGVHVIPVLVDEARMPTGRDLPDALRGLATRHAVRLDHETFNSDVGPLLSAAERILRPLLAESTDQQNRHPTSGAPPDPRPAPGRHSSELHRPAAEESPGGHNPREASARVPASAWRPLSHPRRDDGIAPSDTSTRAKPEVPIARVAWRIALWWATYFLAIFAATGIFSVLITPSQSDLTAGIGASLFLCALLAGIVFALRREIGKQRGMLDASGAAWQMSGNALSPRHVRVVAIICAVVSLAIGVGVALTPPASGSGEGSPSSSSTSLPPTRL